MWQRLASVGRKEHSDTSLKPITRMAVVATVLLAPLLGGVPATAQAARQPSPPVWPLPGLVPSPIKNALGERLVTVMLIAPDDGDRRGLDPAVATAIVAEADRIWARLSNGRIRFVLERVVDFVPADPGVVRCGVPLASWAAARIGWVPAPRRHIVAIQPSNGCDWAGTALLFDGRSWIDWREPSVRPESIGLVGSVLAHELAHNLGLRHTSSATCSTLLTHACDLDAELKPADRGAEYGGDDLLGGDLGARPLNPIHLVHLGLLTPAEVATVDAARPGRAVATLTPAGSGVGTQALRIVSADRRTTWWISRSVTQTCHGTWSWNDCIFVGWDAAPGFEDVIRVHVDGGSPRWPRALQQRSADGTPYLAYGTEHRFPGGRLSITAVEGSAIVEVVVD